MTAVDGDVEDAHDQSAVLRLDGIVKSYSSRAGQLRVLDGVDLTLGPREIVALAGRSGSGKTTLLTIVAGWDRPDVGSVAVGRAARPGDLSWGELAIVPQSLGLLDELTVAENITLSLRLGGSRSELPDHVMHRLGIDHLADRFPSEVSLGEQQRTAVARAAVIRPQLLLADEPIAHQNTEWAEAIMALLRELADGGTTCLLATHNAVAFTAADRVVEMHAGRLRPLARAD